MDKLSNDELLKIMQQMKSAYDSEISNLQLELDITKDLLQNENEFHRIMVTDFCKCKSCNTTIKNVVHYGDGEETYFDDEIYKCSTCNNRFCGTCCEVDFRPIGVRNKYYCTSCYQIKNISLK